MMRNLESFGQHYLADRETINTFISIANISGNERVLEIGAGDGRISLELAKRAKAVVSFEIDKQTEDILERIERKYKNVKFVFKNFLFEEEIKDEFFDKIISCLPFQITEPFIEKIINMQFCQAILIVGKTYADNAVAKSPTSKLSLLTKCFFVGERLSDIPSAAFDPPPRTMSSFLRLTPISKVSLPTKLYLMWELFEQRDKKVKNALKEGLIRMSTLRGRQLTQKEGIAIVNDILGNLEEVGQMYIEQMSNEKILSLYHAIEQYFDVK